MTNEEAKQRLIDYLPYLSGEEWKETYRLAIAALDNAEKYYQRGKDDMLLEIKQHECLNED